MTEVEAKTPEVMNENETAVEKPVTEEAAKETKPADAEVNSEKIKKKHSVRSWFKKLTNFHGKSPKCEKKGEKSEPMANGKEKVEEKVEAAEEKREEEPAAAAATEVKAEEENNGECQPQNGDENCETCEKHE